MLSAKKTCEDCVWPSSFMDRMVTPPLRWILEDCANVM